MIEIYSSGWGIGDSVCALYAACGLANKEETTYYSRHPEFFERIFHPNLLILPHEEKGYDMNNNYNEHIEKGTKRKEQYCENIAKQANINTFIPSKPKFIDKLCHNNLFKDNKKIVLISPFSAWQSREWSSVNYAMLCELLNQNDYKPVVIVTENDNERANETFGYLGDWMTWVYGASPQWLAEAILSCHCVIGNDSGITHLSGLLETNTIAIHSQLSPELLWSNTEIISVVPNTECRFCRWQPKRGYMNSCNRLCTALASIHPEKVLEKVLEIK